MSTNDNVVFEQFTMFNLIPITTNILYWKNALSYSDLLPNFIEWVDSYEESYFKISKWNNNIKIINMDVLKKSTGIDLLDKRILYIVNSLTMAFEMCFERYSKQMNLNENEYTLNFKNINISKNQEISLKNDSAAFYIIANLNDNYQGGEIFFTDINSFFKTEAASVLIMPVEKFENYKINNVIHNTRYVAICEVYKNIKEVQN